MKNITLIALLFGICVIGKAYAEPPGLLAPNKFVVEAMVIESSDELFDQWDHPDGKNFSIVPIKIAEREKPISAIIMFKNCRANSSSECNAIADITIYDPNGNVYGQNRNGELWVGKPAPALGYSQLSRSYMGIVIEKKDPAGIYRVVVNAKDLVANTQSESNTQFEVK
jgi:hypothetical protein